MSKVFYPARVATPRVGQIAVNWYPNSTAAPSTVHGWGVASVVRQSTGNYKLTLGSQWRHILGAHHAKVSATATSGVFVNTLYSDGYRGSSASSYIVIEHRVNGTLTDLATGTNEIVSSAITVCDSSMVE